MHIRYLALLVQSPALLSLETGIPGNEQYQMQRQGQTETTPLTDGVASWLLIPYLGTTRGQFLREE